MAKNSKEKTNSNKKRYLIFLILFSLIIILPFPIYYSVTYFNNKIDPFVEEIATLKEEGYNIEYEDGLDFDEFGFDLICKDLDLNKGYKATFSANLDISDKIISNIEMKVAFGLDWTGFYKTSSKIRLKNGENNQITNIYDIEPLIKKESTDILLPLDKATTYVLLTYTRGNNNKTKYAYVLEYDFGDYQILKGGYPS